MTTVFPLSDRDQAEGIVIQLLSPTDETAELLYEVAEKSYASGSPWSVAQFKENIQAPFTHYVGLFFNETCIGFAAFFILDEEAEIHHVAVQREFQHKGMGKKLLRSVLSSSLVEEVQSVFLEVRVSNTPALALYVSLGFTKKIKRPRYYTHPIEDAWVMAYEKESTKENHCGKRNAE